MKLDLGQYNIINTKEGAMGNKKRKIRYLNWHFARARACKKALALFNYRDIKK